MGHSPDTIISGVDSTITDYSCLGHARYFIDARCFTRWQSNGGTELLPTLKIFHRPRDPGNPSRGPSWVLSHFHNKHPVLPYIDVLFLCTTVQLRGWLFLLHIVHLRRIRSIWWLCHPPPSTPTPVARTPNFFLLPLIRRVSLVVTRSPFVQRVLGFPVKVRN